MALFCVAMRCECGAASIVLRSGLTDSKSIDFSTFLGVAIDAVAATYPDYAFHLTGVPAVMNVRNAANVSYRPVCARAGGRFARPRVTCFVFAPSPPLASSKSPPLSSTTWVSWTASCFQSRSLSWRW